MSKVPKSKWTKLEKEFDKLVCMSESRDQVTRIIGRANLREFELIHGTGKLKAMWERIK
jgi:hypothetical protein